MRKERGNQMYDRMKPGGLMRCCVESITDLYPDGPAAIATEGQTLRCKYAPDNPAHRMIFRAGAWEWDWPVEVAMIPL